MPPSLYQTSPVERKRSGKLQKQNKARPWLDLLRKVNSFRSHYMLDTRIRGNESGDRPDNARSKAHLTKSVLYEEVGSTPG